MISLETVVPFLICFPVIVAVLMFITRNSKERAIFAYVGAVAIIAAVGFLLVDWVTNGCQPVALFVETETINHVILVAENCTHVCRNIPLLQVQKVLDQHPFYCSNLHDCLCGFAWTKAGRDASRISGSSFNPYVRYCWSDRLYDCYICGRLHGWIS